MSANLHASILREAHYDTPQEPATTRARRDRTILPSSKFSDDYLAARLRVLAWLATTGNAHGYPVIKDTH
jgi:hypothetical protein